MLPDVKCCCRSVQEGDAAEHESSLEGAGRDRAVQQCLDATAAAAAPLLPLLENTRVCIRGRVHSLMEVKAPPFIIIAAAVRCLSPSAAVQRLTEAQTAAHLRLVHTAN